MTCKLMQYDHVKENAAKSSQEMLGWSLSDGAAEAGMAQSWHCRACTPFHRTGLLK